MTTYCPSFSFVPLKLYICKYASEIFVNSFSAQKFQYRTRCVYKNIEQRGGMERLFSIAEPRAITPAQST